MYKGGASEFASWSTPPTPDPVLDVSSMAEIAETTRMFQSKTKFWKFLCQAATSPVYMLHKYLQRSPR